MIKKELIFLSFFVISQSTLLASGCDSPKSKSPSHTLSNSPKNNKASNQEPYEYEDPQDTLERTATEEADEKYFYEVACLEQLR